MLLANGILSDVERRRVYTGAYCSLRHPLDQDPFGGGSTIIPSAFPEPQPSPDSNGQCSNPDASHDEGYADDGARGPRARRRERKPDAEAEEVFQRPGFTLFVRSS